jgi:hypothetical protein
MTVFCPGYVARPYSELVADYPTETSYPFKDFRVEWGPIFHRGRLDGSARVLMIGQDPGQHENVLRRILAGEAGRRVQGFLAKLGITESYVLINALLYSAASSKVASYVNQPAVQTYRDSWLDAIFAPGKVEAVVTFGTMARDAWRGYASRRELADDIAVALSTDFFEFGTTKNNLWKQGCAVEMGDAALGLAVNDLGPEAPNWLVIRNASDPAINAALPRTPRELDMQAHWAVWYYEAFGYWTSVNSAIAVWAVIAGDQGFER